MGMHTVVEVGYGGLGWCHEHMDLQRLGLAEIQHWGVCDGTGLGGSGVWWGGGGDEFR